jgi:hypothetical protein
MEGRANLYVHLRGISKRTDEYRKGVGVLKLSKKSYVLCTRALMLYLETSDPMEESFHISSSLCSNFDPFRIELGILNNSDTNANLFHESFTFGS